MNGSCQALSGDGVDVRRGCASPGDLAGVLADLAIDLHDRSDVDSTMQAIVETAMNLIPSARWAGVSLTRARRTECRAPSAPLVVDLDDVQSRCAEGPRLTAMRRRRPVIVDDVATVLHWPDFVRAANQHGVRGFASLPLLVGSTRTLGAVNLYADHVAAFDPMALLAAELLTQHAAVALAASIARQDLEEAVASRDVIGQAKGIVMHRDGRTAEQAFQLLVEGSQAANVKLVKVARWLVRHHEHPATTHTASSCGLRDERAGSSIAHTSNGREHTMPNSSIKNEEMYEELRKDGDSKQKAARISNAAASRGSSTVGRKGGEAGSYDDWTVDQLKKRARELGLTGYSRSTKQDLICKLRNH